MRLYPRDGQDSLVHEGVAYHAGHDGGFDLPEHVAVVVRRFHVSKRPLWETDIERQDREAAELADQRKDPATLLDAVNQLVAAAQAVAPVGAPAPPMTRREPQRPRGKSGPVGS